MPQRGNSGQRFSHLVSNLWTSFCTKQGVHSNLTVLTLLSPTFACA